MSDICFNPSSLDCTSERLHFVRSRHFCALFQSFFSGLYFWKEAIVTNLVPSNLSFNPSSLDCTSESVRCIYQRQRIVEFQSFFSGLYFWKPENRVFDDRTRVVSILLLWIVLLKDNTQSIYTITEHSFNPSSLDCTSERSNREGGNILYCCFNPSSLDCTSESEPNLHILSWRMGFQSFFSGLYFWKLRWYPSWYSRNSVSILLLWIVLLKVKAG